MVQIECTIDCAFHFFVAFGMGAFDGLVVLQHMSNIFFEVSPKERLKLNYAVLPLYVKEI